MFSITAQVVGVERSAQVKSDGLGITIQTDAGLCRAGSWNEAVRIARDYIGEHLRPAHRPGVPWGLRVTVPDGSAVYGEWPLVSGPPPSSAFEQTPLSQIRRRHDGSSATAALENALAIVRAYIPRRRAAA